MCSINYQVLFIFSIVISSVATMLVQEKYEEATAALVDMEKRVVMAESMLEATLQYQSGQLKAQPSPRWVENGCNSFHSALSSKNVLKGR